MPSGNPLFGSARRKRDVQKKDQEASDIACHHEAVQPKPHPRADWLTAGRHVLPEGPD